MIFCFSAVVGFKEIKGAERVYAEENVYLTYVPKERKLSDDFIAELEEKMLSQLPKSARSKVVSFSDSDEEIEVSLFKHGIRKIIQTDMSAKIESSPVKISSFKVLFSSTKHFNAYLDIENEKSHMIDCLMKM